MPEDALTFEPLPYSAFSATPEAARLPDEGSRIKAYDDRLRQDLFARGLYDDAAEEQIASASAQQRTDLGIEDTSAAPAIGKLAFQIGDYDSARRAEAGEEVDALGITQRAVRGHHVPFATVDTPDGTVLEVDADLGPRNKEEILELARSSPNFDYRALPHLEKELTRVPGSNYTPAQIRQARSFENFVTAQGKSDKYLDRVIEIAQDSYNRGDFEEYTKNRGVIMARLDVLDGDKEFSEETRGRLLDDVVKRSASMDDYDPAKPENSVQFLNSGEVVLPHQTVLNKDLYEKTLDKLTISDEQKEQALAAREPRLAALAPLFVDALGADPDALDAYTKARAAGETDAGFVEKYFSDPKNYSKLGNRVNAVGMAFKDAVLGIPLSAAALVGNERARDAMIGMAQDRARNEKYAELFGDKYGLGQTVVNTAPQVVADLLVTRGAGMVARNGVQAATRGLSAATRGAVGTAIREGAPGTALKALASDTALNFGAMSGVTFLRSAGSQYASVYSALGDEYSEEEKRRIALGAATVSGLATAGITAGFSLMGAGGVEDLATGKLTSGMLKKSFGLTDDVVAEGVRSSAKAVLGGALSEGAEEGIDQLVTDMTAKFATDEDFRLGPALKEALEAGLVGGIFGGVAGAVESRLREPVPTPTDMGLPSTEEAAGIVFPAARNFEAEALPFAPAVNADAEALPMAGLENFDAEALPFTPPVNEVERVASEASAELEQELAPIGPEEQLLLENDTAVAELVDPAPAEAPAEAPADTQVPPTTFRTVDEALGAVQDPVVETQKDPDFAASVEQGRFFNNFHGQIFSELANKGYVPELNTLKGALKGAGFGGPKYAAAFHKKLESAVKERFPIAKHAGTEKTIKALTGQDVKRNGKLLSVPVLSDTAGAWTNDPVTTAHQINAGLKVKASAGSRNPSISVGRGGFVSSVALPDGQIITGKGDWNRAGTAVTEYSSYRNDPDFVAAVNALPEASLSGSSRIPGGPEMTPQTTEADLLAHFFSPRGGGLSRVAASVARTVPENFSGADKDAIVASVQTAFLKDMREWSLAHNEESIVDIEDDILFALTPAADRKGQPATGFKNYLKRRGKAWRNGHPVSPAAFIKQEIDGMTDGKSRRASVQTMSDTDDESGESKLERAAARNTFGGMDSQETVLLDQTTSAGLAALARASYSDLAPSDSLMRLVEAVRKEPKLKSLFQRAVVQTSGFQPGSNQALTLATNTKGLSTEELVMEVANTVIRTPNALSYIMGDRSSYALKDALASLAYGVSQHTDAEVEQFRAANMEALADLNLGAGLRASLEKVARSPRYPRRYRAVARAAIESPILDSLQLSIVDRPVEAYAGLFVHGSRSIVLNMASSNGRGLLDVLAHETVHAMTVSAIEDPRTAAAKQLRDKLEKLRSEVSDVVPDNFRYAVSDLSEFVAHAFTDPGFQRLVQSVESRGRTIWQRILDAVARFLGRDMNTGFMEDLMDMVRMGNAHAAMFGYPVSRAGARAGEARAASTSPVPVTAPRDDVNDALADLLPQGFEYEFEDVLGGRSMAFSQRSRPGIITVNRAELGRAVEGLDPSNARAFIQKVVKHELAHHTVFSAMSPGEIEAYATALPLYEVSSIALRYYQGAGMTREEAMKRVDEDLKSGVLTVDMIAEESLRSLLEKATSGSTTEDTLSFYRRDPGVLQRALKYLGDVLKQLWGSVAGYDDIHTRVAISRLMREHRRIANGMSTRPVPTFDSNDPQRDNRRIAALAIEDPKAPPVGGIIESLQPTVWDSKDPFDEGTFWSRLFKFRSGDARPAQIAAERDATLRAATSLIEKHEKDLAKAMKAESPDRAVVQAAAGSTKPYISAEQASFIDEQFNLAIEEAMALDDLDEQAEARDEAYNMRREMQQEARLETARQAKEDQARAWEILEESAPLTLQAIKDTRATIDHLSKQLAKWMPDGDLKVIVGELGQGIYLTRSYNLHHKDGDPLSIFTDPELEPAVTAAENMFVQDYVETRAPEIMEEREELDEVISLDDARALALEEANDGLIGRAMLENYLLRHGSKAFFNGGSNTRIDLTRYMKRGTVPEVLRDVLEEETDPVHNLIRTAFNVSMLAANTRHLHEQARIGKAAGYFVTEAQKKGFRPLIQTVEEEAFIQEAVRLGWAKGTERVGYVEKAPGIFLPDWLLKAHEERNVQLLDGYRTIANDNVKYGAGELDGLFAPPVLADWWEHEFKNEPMVKTADETFMRKVGDLFGKATGLSLGIATLGSVGFYARNFVSTAYFLMGQGLNPLSPESVKALGPAWREARRDPDAYTVKLQALGVIGDNVRPQTMKELIRGLSDRPGEGLMNKLAATLAGKKGEGYVDMAKARLGELADAASAIDSYGKVIAYEMELDVLRRAHEVDHETAPSVEETRRMENEAANKVRQTFQARSQTPPLVEAFTGSVAGRLIAPFARFKADMIRVNVNTWRVGLTEVKSENPVIKTRGYRRLAGYSAVAAMSIGLPIFLNALSGVSGDEEDALRSALPKYMRGSSVFFIPDDEGNVSSLDLSFVNPHSYLFDPVARTLGAIARGEPGDAVEDVATWLSASWLDDQIAIGAALEVRNNRDADNKPIWLATDGTDTKMAKAIEHLVGSGFTPQSFKAVDRAIDAAKNGVSESAGIFETPGGLLLGHAMPVRPRSYAVSELAYRSYKELAQSNREVRMTAGRLKSRQVLGEDQIEDIVGDWQNGMQAVYEDAVSRARGFEGLGMEKAAITKSMVDAGFSRDRSKSLVFSNRTTAPVLSPAMRRDVLEAGTKAAGNDKGGEERLRMVNEVIRSRPPVIVVD